MIQPINTAMIFAAGLGTRLKPWTDNHPKALAIVNGKSLLQRNVEYLKAFGIKKIVVNVHHFADQIMDAIALNKSWGADILISDETDVVLETGGGLKKAAPSLASENNFVVMNCDILTDLNLTEMYALHFKQQNLATLAVTQRETSRYFLFNQQMRLCGWRNKKTGEEKIPLIDNGLQEKAFSGVHIINRQLFSVMQQQGKFSMVDVYLSLCKGYAIQGFDHTGGKLIDVGKPESIATAEKLFA